MNFAGTSANGQDAPIPALRCDNTKGLSSTMNRPSCARRSIGEATGAVSSHYANSQLKPTGRAAPSPFSDR